MTDTPTAVEVNCETGEVTTRPLTAEEIAANEVATAEAEARKAEEDLAAAALEDQKLAVLKKLGLTSNEVAALLS